MTMPAPASASAGSRCFHYTAGSTEFLCHMTDAALLMRLHADTAEGNQRAYRELYEATSWHLFGVLVRILNRRAWEKEELKDCYIKRWQKTTTKIGRASGRERGVKEV